MTESPLGRVSDALRRRISPRVRIAVRHALTRADNPEVRQARGLLKLLRGDPPRILHLGDSTAHEISPNDTDRRSLARMLADELAAVDGVHTIAGGGYGPALHEAYLGLVAAGDARPLIVHTLCFRMLYPLSEHPAYGKRAAMERIRELDPATPPWRVRASLRRPGADAFERYYRLPHETILGRLTVGDYVRPLRSDSLNPEERLRLLYAYHHGALLSPDSPTLGEVTRLGERLRDLRCRTVAYITAPCVETGVELFGTRFADVVASNQALMEEAYRKGICRDATVLQTGRIFSAEEFVDPADGTEHLNQRGRTRHARIIAEAVVAELEGR